MSDMKRTLGFLAILVSVQAGALGAPPRLPAQTIEGMVYDDDTGMPLQGASISVLSANFESVIQGRADAMGRFRYLLPDSGTYLVSAIMSGYATSAPEVLMLGPGEEVTVMLPLWSLDPQPAGVSVRATEGSGEGADIFGRVVDFGTGQGITNVEVTIQGQNKSAVTDVNGRFFIRDAQGPDVRVYFQHLSYAPREARVEIEPRIAYELSVQMEPEPLEIPGIVVSTTPRIIARRLQPVYERMDRAVTAYFRTDEDFASRGYPPVGSMIRGFPRIRVNNYGAQWRVRMGGAVTLDGSPCMPVVYLDGMRVSSSGDTQSLSEMMAMPTFDVAVIEVYPGAASLPPEFNDPGTMCAIGIWTKRGGSD
jgi:hypothetical protein